MMYIVCFGMFKRSGSAYEELCTNKVLEAEFSYLAHDLRVTDNITFHANTYSLPNSHLHVVQNSCIRVYLWHREDATN